MNAIWIWGAALLLYGVFSLWYNNLRGRLTPAEIDAYMARLQAAPVADRDPALAATVRAFLESDDGGEFFMANLVRLQPGPVEIPGSGEREPARKVLDRYTSRFMPALFKRAGHPAFAAPAAGGYVEHWGVEPDPGWSFVGLIRYRSRRDMIELVIDPAFDPAHAFKIAAVATTLAFPVAPAIVSFGPRLWVGLGLALAAAVGQIASLLLRGTAA